MKLLAWRRVNDFSYSIIIIIKIQTTVQGEERVKTLCQFEDPNSTKPTHGRKKKRISRRRKKTVHPNMETLAFTKNIQAV